MLETLEFNPLQIKSISIEAMINISSDRKKSKVKNGHSRNVMGTRALLPSEETKHTESARSKNAGGLCFLSSEAERLSEDAIPFSKDEAFILSDYISEGGGFLPERGMTEQKVNE